MIDYKKALEKISKAKISKKIIIHDLDTELTKNLLTEIQKTINLDKKFITSELEIEIQDINYLYITNTYFETSLDVNIVFILKDIDNIDFSIYSSVFESRLKGKKAIESFVDDLASANNIILSNKNNSIDSISKFKSYVLSKKYQGLNEILLESEKTENIVKIVEYIAKHNLEMFMENITYNFDNLLTSIDLQICFNDLLERGKTRQDAVREVFKGDKSLDLKLTTRELISVRKQILKCMKSPLEGVDKIFYLIKYLVK